MDSKGQRARKHVLLSSSPFLPSLGPPQPAGLTTPLPQDSQAGLHLTLVNREKGVKGQVPAKLGSGQVKRKAGGGPPSSWGLLIALASPSSPVASAAPRPPSPLARSRPHLYSTVPFRKYGSVLLLTKKPGQGHLTSHQNLPPGHCCLAACQRWARAWGSLASLGCWEERSAKPRGERLLHVAAFRHAPHHSPPTCGCYRPVTGLAWTHPYTPHGLVFQYDWGQPSTPRQSRGMWVWREVTGRKSFGNCSWRRSRSQTNLEASGSRSHAGLARGPSVPGPHSSWQNLGKKAQSPN